MGAIDFHAHAFPDALAARAVRHLEQEGDIQARVDGTVSGLLASMDAAGVERTVVASIATKPSQFEPIMQWSKAIVSDRIIPFPSLHPTDPDAADRIRLLAAEGFIGIKLHPYYQDFYLDEDRMGPLYEAVQDTGLVLLMHTGFDLAFERIRRADPVRLMRVVEAFPRLRIVATHLGAWEDWDAVREHFLGRPVFTDFSYTIPFLKPGEARELLAAHPREYLVFGTDSPWADQAEALAEVHALDFGEEWERLVLHDNADRLLRPHVPSVRGG